MRHERTLSGKICLLLRRHESAPHCLFAPARPDSTGLILGALLIKLVGQFDICQALVLASCGKYAVLYIKSDCLICKKLSERSDTVITYE